MKAIWQEIVLAESDNTFVIEDNHYFPPESVNRKYLEENPYHTICPGMGTSNHFNLVIGDDIIKNVAWYYPSPEPAAKNIRDYVAFDHNAGVNIVE